MPNDGQKPAAAGYWFNVRTGKVEFGLKTRALDRIGPFRTEAEASRALEILAERSRQWAKSEDED